MRVQSLPFPGAGPTGARSERAGKLPGPGGAPRPRPVAPNRPRCPRGECVAASKTWSRSGVHHLVHRYGTRQPATVAAFDAKHILNVIVTQSC